jgi:DNA repair protein RadC
MDYCVAAMAHEPRQQFRILFLDKRNALMADEVQQIGTVDYTCLPARSDRTGTFGECNHSHPQSSPGDPTPSKADIEMTRTIANIGAQMGIVVMITSLSARMVMPAGRA